MVDLKVKYIEKLTPATNKQKEVETGYNTYLSSINIPLINITANQLPSESHQSKE